MDFAAPFSLMDRRQRTVLDFEMINRPVSRCAPSGGIFGLHSEAETCLRAFFLGKQTVARCDAHRTHGRGDDAGGLEIFNSALSDRFIVRSLRFTRSHGSLKRGGRTAIDAQRALHSHLECADDIDPAVQEVGRVLGLEAFVYLDDTATAVVESLPVSEKATNGVTASRA